MPLADAAHAAPPDAPPELQHHFVDLEAQKEASSLGMWVFLVTEVLFFGGMFTAYVVYRSSYRAAFEGASNLLDIRLGAFNTAVLIVSSLTMALAVWAAAQGKQEAHRPLPLAHDPARRRLPRREGQGVRGQVRAP